MVITVVFQILILVFSTNMVNSSHFQGGTITYKIVGTSGSTASIMITQTYIYRWPVVYCDDATILAQSPVNISYYAEYYVNLTCVSNCNNTGGYQPVPIITYCTDYSSATDITVTQRTDVVNITIGAYFTVAFQSGNWRTLNLPTPASSAYGWSIACTIDLLVRSDTGKLNTPPVATMISPVDICVGIPTVLVIPTIDSDNDVVRCRFANSTDECAAVCPPASLPNNTVLISSNCTLLITGANVGDWYAVALQIEDYIDSNSTSPLSSVPVQFLVYVYALPNCTTPPLLYGPFNQTGTCQSLQVGQAHTITLYVVNYCSAYGVTIQDISTLSFPIITKTNLTQNTSSLYWVSLTWAPTANEVGSQILCAVAIDSQYVQSNQYCVTFEINENSTGTCPGENVETTTSLASTKQIFDATTTDQTTVITTTTDQTTVITNTTIINTTTSSTSDEWPWVLPLLVAALASLLLSICCSCICCRPPYGCGLLCRKRDEDEPSEPIPNSDGIRRPPRMYMIRRALGKKFDDLNGRDSRPGSSKSIISADNRSSRFPITLRSSANKKEKNLVWVYPSPRAYNISRPDSNLSSSRSATSSDRNLAPFPLTVRNSANKNKNVVWVQPSSKLENVSRPSSPIESSRSTTESDINLDSSSATSLHSANKQRKNIVRVHPLD